MKKNIVGLSAAAVVMGSFLSGGTIVNAQSTAKNTETGTHHHRIRWDVRLNQAVRDGTITSAQETALKAELETLQADISKSSMKVERKAEHAKLTAALDSWAKSNNFPLSKIAPKLAS